MAKDRQDIDYLGPLKRLLTGIVVLLLIVVFLVWRIDSPRVERYRAMVLDRVVPPMTWAMAPVTAGAKLVGDFQSYNRLLEQNGDLRRELQEMKAWREAALQLEQENAKLRALNQLRVDPRLTWITGVVLADAGSPFRQSVLLNIGSRDGLLDGWAVIDDIGLVGRIAGVGDDTARVILLSDTSSRLPVKIQPSGQEAVLAGDNTISPPLLFLDNEDAVRPGDRVVSSGAGPISPSRWWWCSCRCCRFRPCRAPGRGRT